ncbi:hypothetical protein D5F01_LYC18808 [Larimichthys crocea]|uniref:Uncharacterized protein n=1 Tax=Larimichthys crocea TaxID=215358 RepID=A0A6G0HWQ1_LARCR|nr:hypothetical protein D5F01_LYC18808 [Larimichthys crocea]
MLSRGRGCAASVGLPGAEMVTAWCGEPVTEERDPEIPKRVARGPAREVPQGGFLHPSIEDKRLSKPHLESSEGSLWPGLAPSMAGLQQRNHRGANYLWAPTSNLKPQPATRRTLQLPSHAVKDRYEPLTLRPHPPSPTSKSPHCSLKQLGYVGHSNDCSSYSGMLQ